MPGVFFAGSRTEGLRAPQRASVALHCQVGPRPWPARLRHCASADRSVATYFIA